MIKKILFFIAVVVSGVAHDSHGQINARLLQYPDVSETQITFVYGGDIWIVSKEGGIASKLSSPAGDESFPKFSPDGSKIAFSGNYDGNVDIYMLDSKGGIPSRITYHGSGERMLGWHPTNGKILFVSTRESGRQRFSQFYLINQTGGVAERMVIPFGENGSFSQDGKWFAYTDKSRLNRTWKRYRGGMAPEITLFNLEEQTSENIAVSDANEELPMWHGNNIYFLSDRGENKRFNIWSVDATTKQLKQLTQFDDVDVHYPSIGPSDMVFEAGGDLYLMDLASGKYEKVNITVISDLRSAVPKTGKVKDYISGASISPDGKRVIVEARGELFSVPAEHGYVKNLSNTSGVAERHPAWSPNGKYIAYFSDRSGEYELTLLNLETGDERKMTSYGPGFRYWPYWSPDSKKIAFVEQSMKIKIFDMESNRTMEVDQGLSMFEGVLQNFNVSWSSDSRWMTWSRGLKHRVSAIFLYDTKNETRHQLTSGYYSDQDPAFDPDGKYLYLSTNRNFSPSYSDFDNKFIYTNSTHIAAVSLRKDVPSPLASRNDEVEIKEEKEKISDSSSDKNKKKDKSKTEDKTDDEEKIKPVDIDIDGFESRMVLLPPAPGNYNNIKAISGKVIYHQFPNTGSADRNRSIKYYDLEEREEKTIMDNANGFELSADGKKMLVTTNGTWGIVDIIAGQKVEKPLRVDEMEMLINPKEEWKQIFNDAWRFERDFFYEPGMHGVDWSLMRTRYGALIEDAVTRSDVNFIIGELIAELSASHTYRGGGDSEESKRLNVGYLGVDWEISNGFYRIKEIIKTAPWEIEVRSPLSQPGIEVANGEYILAVNGNKLDINKEPFAAFQGLGNKTVELTVNSQPQIAGSRKIIVDLLDSEERLRHLAWIEHYRKQVDEATEGRVGYIYVQSTGIDGQNELVRQYSGQWKKDALIIDERFNSGGQIPDRFIELLNRKPLAYWAVRDGEDWQWPPVAHFGPKVMLINGWSGSGGDAFPDYFRKAELGPLVGARTWGGLIGISGSPSLIDGGNVTVPTFRMYDPDGEWFKEGHGVDPDVEVLENAGLLSKGHDVQLEKAIEIIQKALQDNPYKKPDHPPYEKR